MNSISNEFINCNLGDKRLNERLIFMAEEMFSNIGQTIPLAFGHWAGTKAAYRFLNHAKIKEDQILKCHFQETAKRFQNNKDRVLIMHDTSEFTYHRKGNQLGQIGINNSRGAKITIQGILMHSSLALTTTGLPIGITAVKFWTRKKFKGTNELKRHINPTRMPINKKESVRWLQNIRQTNELLSHPQKCVHIGDREADIFELFSECKKSESSFVVRLAVDRCMKNSKKKLFDSVNEEPVKGRYKISIHSSDGKIKNIWVEVRISQVNILPPIGKQKFYEPISGYYIEAKERVKKSTNRKPRVEWKLLTNISVNNFSQAYEKIKWYALR